MNNGPLIVQSDKFLLLEVNHPQAVTAGMAIRRFAQLERSPEHIHTYRLTALNLWNAKAAGDSANDVIDTLTRYSRYPIPQPLVAYVRSTMAKYGQLSLRDHPRHGLVLQAENQQILESVLQNSRLQSWASARPTTTTLSVSPAARTELKQVLMKSGWPVRDEAGYRSGPRYPIVRVGTGFPLRGYQQAAVEQWRGAENGVVVLPCGSGKTFVGMAAMITSATHTLVVASNRAARTHWKDQLVAHTSVKEDQVKEYSNRRPEVGPITIMSCQSLARRSASRPPTILTSFDWGLIVFDDVHLLSAGAFRLAAALPDRRQLGLAATLARDDGEESSVFCTIGPKRYEPSWADLATEGWAPPGRCVEVQVALSDAELQLYKNADTADRYAQSATARAKLSVTRGIVRRHSTEQILIIGTFHEQLVELSELLGAPLVGEETGGRDRDQLLSRFRRGRIHTLLLHKALSLGVDLPEAAVAIQVSETMSFRHEEALRLGRLLRPSAAGHTAYLYTVVSRDTIDQDQATQRRRFLVAQGYPVSTVDADDFLR